MFSQNTQPKLANKKFYIFSIFFMLILKISFMGNAHATQDVVSKVESDSLQGTKALSQMLKRHKGKVIYLDFWASWCVPCRKSFPWMNAMQDKYKKDGFVVVAVNLDAEVEKAQKFLTKHKANFEIVYDPNGKTPEKYRVKGMPSSYLIGRDGKVKISHTGFFQKKKLTYENEIQALLKN